MTGFSPPKIAQIALQCTDLAQAKAFYCDVLGLPLAGQVGDSIFVACGEVNLIVQKVTTVREGSQIYFSADGQIEEATAAFKAKGIVFTQEPKQIARNHQGVDVWLGFFKDPFGNSLALIANMPPAP